MKANLHKYRKIPQSLCLFVFLFVLISVSYSFFEVFAGDEGVTLQTVVQSYLEVSIDSDTVDMGNLQPGSPVIGDTTITTTTNGSSGYQIQVKRNNSDYTLKKGSDYITDKSDWNPTANEGDGNASTWSGTGLAFRVKSTGTTSTYNSTWWGADDTTNAKFAGFPSSSTQLMNHTSYSAGSTVTKTGYKCDVSNTQATGSYEGGITYSIVGN